MNKIDLVGYSEDVFTAVATDFALLARSLGVLETHCIPVSATEGDNVVTRSHRTPWYDGPTSWATWRTSTTRGWPWAPTTVPGSARGPTPVGDTRTMGCACATSQR